MGSLGFYGEDESQPSTSNGKKYKLPRTLLDGCGAGNHASVPRKLRSAIKKRGRESVTSLLPISRKQHHVSNGVETLKRGGAKKSKLNMKQGDITKDEEEVAETLYALASMFSDTYKANQPGLDDEPPETKSSAILEAGSSMNAVQDTGILTLREESRKISSKVTLEAASGHPSASGVQSNLSLGPRPRVSTLDITPSGEQAIDLEQVTASGIQYGKNYYPMDDKHNGLFLSPSLSATGAPSSETQGSCLRLPAWFESTNYASQPRVIENSVTSEKYTQVAVESKKSWKRSSAHVYISRLIKVLQISERKEGLLEKPTQVTACGGAELQPHVSTHNQMTGVNGRNGGVSFNGIAPAAAEKDSAEIQNDIRLHKRPIQDQQLASETSASCSTKQGYDFLSLGTGVCGLDASEGVNSEGCSHEAPKQFHVSYMQSENHSAMLFSLAQNGYSSIFHGHISALAAQQVQPPQYLSSTGFTTPTGRQLELQQQKWAAQLPTQYNAGGVGGAPHLPDWKNGGRDSPSMLNYAHALFPHLHAALGSKYQQFSPPQQQLMAINSSLPLSNVKRHHYHHLPLGFERNGAAFYPENMQQLQLPCNQHL
ncbi:hypothetical protein Pfo_021503 [Paulownia fortunei]|nr:hypothetical protein Pfo_021503 [Paulownia fortunei]